MDLRIEREPFGIMPDGRTAELFTLGNPGGIRVRLTNYAGTVTSVETPDRDGTFGNVVLGFDSLEGYLGTPFVCSLIGRFANRIARGRFTLDGQQHELPINDGPNHLHGGPEGFHRKLWYPEPFSRPGAAGVVLSYTSEDGEEGYPGRLEVRVTVTLTADDELVLDYHGVTDLATPVNLTHHGYFNLAADPDRDILGHELTVNATRFTPVDATMIPTGELASVTGTPFDFARPAAVGARIDQDDPQLRYGQGYDHNLVLDQDDQATTGPRLAARLYSPESGRVLEVSTTQPGIQVYTGFRNRHAIALETQHFPDSPNQPGFPSTILRPGESYHETTVLAFSVRSDPAKRSTTSSSRSSLTDRTA